MGHPHRKLEASHASPTPQERVDMSLKKKEKSYQDQKDGSGVKSTFALAQDPGSTPSVHMVAYNCP